MAEIDLTDSTFDAELKKSDILVVDLWAEWCAPCKMLGPVIADLTREFDGKAMMAKVDIDSNPAITTRFGVSSIPTLLFFKKGELADRLTGAHPRHAIAEKIQKLLAS